MLSGLIPRQTIAVVPIVGILIGGAMTATTLAGKRALDALRTRHGEYEAALSIGLLPRDSALLIARDDASLALVPGLDQTRTVGLVTLPGPSWGCCWVAPHPCRRRPSSWWSWWLCCWFRPSPCW